ncbi:hypothetical protein [Paraclostridium tenue]|uniref:Lipoprotein n=1 Tax=Paraclostridium tenue TaxID=1737 RepID=A0ABN1LZQ6_9FIRM
MKKLITFLLYMLIVNILVSLLLIININSNKHSIKESSITKAISNNDNYNLIVQILKDTHKENFIKHIDYMQLNIFKNIENDTNNFTAFNITLPQNKSFIAFYKKNSDDTYSFNCIVDNLCNIDNFYFYKNFLVIEQNSEDDSNYLNDKKFIEIFYKEKSIFVSKLKKDLYAQITNLENDNKSILSASMDFLDDNPPKILYVYTISPLDKTSDKKVLKELYIWNNTLNKFTISEDSI